MYFRSPKSSASEATDIAPSIVMLWAWSLAGSIWNWSCFQRSPQMTTFATPGTAISRQRIVQYAIIERSVRSQWSHVSPIFIARLVAESGWSVQGMPADAGRLGIAVATRSFTSWRASSGSVPRSKISVIADRPGTVVERIVSSPGVELSACSIGIVMRVSTSSVDIPRPSVWTSTKGGANSGKTSTGMLLTRVAPNATIPTANATTMKRKCRLDRTIQRIMCGRPPAKA